MIPLFACHVSGDVIYLSAHLSPSEGTYLGNANGTFPNNAGDGDGQCLSLNYWLGAVDCGVLSDAKYTSVVSFK